MLNYPTFNLTILEATAAALEDMKEPMLNNEHYYSVCIFSNISPVFP